LDRDYAEILQLRALEQAVSEDTDRAKGTASGRSWWPEVIPIYKIFDPLAGAESCSGKAGASCWVETLLEAPNAASPTLCPVLWMRALEEVAAFPDQSGTPGALLIGRLALLFKIAALKGQKFCKSV